MTCERFREEIELASGGNSLSEELKVHLVNCAECRAFAAELERMLSRLGNESEFELTYEETKSLKASIEARTQKSRSAHIAPITWVRYGGVAAIVVLSFVGYSGYLRGWFGSGPVLSDSSAIVVPRNDTGPIAQVVSPVDSNWDQSDLATSSSELFLETDAGLVFDSVSDAELKYLEQHFNVKDLL